MESSAIEIIAYQQEHQPWFEKFNRDWIEKYFWMEPIDIQVLQNPEEFIISKGGEILMAQYNKEMAGTVALKFVEKGVYEFTKMAVDEKFQGRKIGYALSIAAIEKAKQLRASKIILFSSTKLETAISLYKKLGFIEVPLDGPYKRSDIKMELPLSKSEAMTTRNAEGKDLEMLLKFSIQTFIDSFGEHNSKEDMDAYINEAFSRDQIEKEFNEQDAKFFLAFIADELVGYARVRNNEEEIQDEDTLEIHRIYAAKNYIAKGIGKVLLNQCIQYAKENAKKSIWLGVWEKNLHAIKFYQKHGFEQFSQHDFLLGQDLQTDILMKKVL